MRIQEQPGGAGGPELHTAALAVLRQCELAAARKQWRRQVMPACI